MLGINRAVYIMLISATGGRFPGERAVSQSNSEGFDLPYFCAFYRNQGIMDHLLP
ncbi:hypothetical protein [Sporosarcina luteola]|uniref:hypothetical protein n=1 Tax=Sporosarcina luteola TaxID=582850 RepID=UPI00203FC1F1|nr:hypothetical protein [Sporosarcina luteola]